MNKPAPRPWEYIPSSPYIDHNGERAESPPHVRYHYRDEQGRRCTAFVAQCVSATLDNDANARFIVQACNSHDELLEVARAIRDCRPEYETAEENQRLTQRLADVIAKAEKCE